MVHIYVLLLMEEKYYIGKTSNPDFRIDHFNNSDLAWTTIYKPVELIELLLNCDNFDEDKYTKIYMSKYGIDNVRGGSYVQIQFEHSIRALLEKEILMSMSNVLDVEKKGHFANDCKYFDLDKVTLDSLTLTIVHNTLVKIINHFDNKIILKSYTRVFESYGKEINALIDKYSRLLADKNRQFTNENLKDFEKKIDIGTAIVSCCISQICRYILEKNMEHIDNMLIMIMKYSKLGSFDTMLHNILNHLD